MKYGFSVPGIAETAFTLAQPLPVRLVPWSVFVGGTAGATLFLARGLMAVWPFRSQLPPSTLLLFPASAAFGVAASFFLADRLRRGNRLFRWVALAWAASLAVRGLRPDADTLGAVLGFLVGGWLLFALLRYGRELELGAASFREAPGYDARKERVADVAGTALLAAAWLALSRLAPPLP